MRQTTSKDKKQYTIKTLPRFCVQSDILWRKVSPQNARLTSKPLANVQIMQRMDSLYVSVCCIA